MLAGASGDSNHPNGPAQQRPNDEALPDPGHFRDVAAALLEGNVVPFLGAGVNLWGRPLAGAVEDPVVRRLPDAKELARQLAPPDWPADDLNLLRVSQYLDLMQGSGPLYRRLRRVFNQDYPVTPLHELLASLHTLIAVRRRVDPGPLIITTNYDCVLERAFQAAGQEFEQITYIADGKDRGLFSHRKWRKATEGASPQPLPAEVIRVPSEYRDPDLVKWARPVLLQIHGAVDTVAEAGDSYVITEDHYIDYLALTDMSSFLPAHIATRIQNSHVLFLAYGLRDWNLRVLLRRIWKMRRLTWTSWAIQRDCEELDRRFWQRHDVEVLTIGLEPYIRELKKHIDAMPPLPEPQR